MSKENILCMALFQSTLLMRGATGIQALEWWRKDDISIHAPHARSDRVGRALRSSARAISIHAPHARSDPG